MARYNLKYTGEKIDELLTKADILTVNDATLTIQKNGITVNTFTANASTNVTANITVPTTLDDISDGSTRKLSNYLLRSGGSDNPLTAPVYINHSDLSFIGTAGGFGFRAAALSGQSVPHLGQINLSKNFGGDGSQYGIQMSAVDITNNLFNQFRVYQKGIAYQQYNNSSGTTTDIFTVNTAGALKTLSDIYEGGTADANKLSNKYLGKTAKAADSDKLDGNDSTYYLNYNNLSNKPTIPTKTSDLTNDSSYTTASSTLTANKILAGNDNKAIKTSELYVGSSTSYDIISTNSSILLEPGQGESIYLGEENVSNVIIGGQGNDEVKLRIYGSLANGTGSQTYSLPSSSGRLATTADILEYELGCSNSTQVVSVPSGGAASLTVSSAQVPLFLGYSIQTPEDLGYYNVHSYEAFINKNSSGWKAYTYAYDGNGSTIDNVYIEVRYVLISVDVV